MPQSEQKLEFANFICRFGDKLVLLDMLEQIVLPAFQDQKLIRISGETTSYQFLDVSIVTLDGSQNAVGVAGRFVKNTTLQSEQVLNRATQQLVQQVESIPTSPSSLFVLMLDTHRLLYVKEVSGAPGLSAFKSTVERFIKTKYKKFIDNLYEERKEAQEQDPSAPEPSKRQLKADFPPPELELVPLASQDSLSMFVQKYETLKAVEIQLLNPNHDLDNDEFFAAIRQKKEDVDSVRTTLRHNNPAGLDKSETIEQLAGVADQGNHFIRLDGSDSSGDRLRGNNEEFQLKMPIDDLGRNVGVAAKRMYLSFKELLTAGTLKAVSVSDKVKRQIAKYVTPSE